MTSQLTIPDIVYSVEKDFNQVNEYKMNFLKEAQFALQLLQGNDYLIKAAQTNPSALEYAIINLASIGISLNPALKEAYLVPRGGKICLDISYIGLTKLATDTGAIEWVQAEIVKKNDAFEYQGVGKAPIHKMNPFSDRGEVIGVYCVARLSSGESLSTIMSKQECDAIRDKSSQAAKSGPWVGFYEEMLKKTVIKRASKLWPKSERVQKAASVLDEHEGIDFSQKPHMDQPKNTDLPTVSTFQNMRDLLKAKNERESKNRTEEDLLNYIAAQNGGEKKEKIEDLNSAEIEYAYRMLGGSK
jgi:recombination protein RecT